MLRPTRACLLALGFLAAASPALAEGLSFDRWRHTCKTDAMTDRISCRIDFAQRVADGFVNVTVTEADEQYLVLVGSSQDLGLLTSCALRVDEFQHVASDGVLQGICMILPQQHDLDTLVAQMKAGRTLLARVDLYARGSRDITIPLNGFTAALRAAGLDRLP